MCGIFGAFGLVDKQLLKKMENSIRHRGPDESGQYIDDNIMLGNVRLIIIDLVTGKQPIYNQDQSLVIIHSGEIYNFPELKAELENKGHKFYTTTDTEVIVHCYEEYGPECVKKFNGMFAFAIWDKNKKTLFLARDRNGIKPLYYTFIDNVLLFASEIKALLQFEQIKREIDLQAFHYFVNLRYLPREYTMFKGIKKLLPGHTLTMSSSGFEIKEFWSPTLEITEKSEEQYLKELEEILESAVRRHLISDVPVGIFLSGGLDSSTIVAMASRIVDGPLQTFCMGFGEPTDEMNDARVVSEYFDTEHRDLLIKADLLRNYPRMIWHADTPKRNLYPYYLAEMVSKYVKVALGGLGGDELFGGYTWKYDYAIHIDDLRKGIPAENREDIVEHAKKLIKFQSTHGVIDDDKYLEYMKKLRYLDSNVDLYLQIQTMDEVFDEFYLPTIYGNKINLNELKDVKTVFEPYFDNNGNFLHQTYLGDYRIKMIDDFIFVDDSMAMAHSLESRVPFLDYKLIDFAFTIPMKYKYTDGVGKYLLKKLAKKILPKSILKKPKQGFGSNVFLTFKWELYDFAKQKLSDGNLIREGLIENDYINKVLNHTPNTDLVKHYCLLWSLLSFEIWYDIYIKNDNMVNPSLNINNFI